MSSEAGQPTEEELRAAYEAELKRLRVEHVLLDNVAMLANLGMRRTGLAPGTEDERDVDQVRLAIESLRALMPVLEQVAPTQVAAVRDAISQLQLAYVRIGGQAPAPGAPESGGGEESGGGGAVPGGTEPTAQEPPPKPGEPGPAQRSGRLWVPGQ
ncbi:MAG: hypothetical protein ACRDPA_22545 [Solirubrobacteraceae bacterium]